MGHLPLSCSSMEVHEESDQRQSHQQELHYNATDQVIILDGAENYKIAARKMINNAIVETFLK